MYVMLKSKQVKLPRNQVIHIMDGGGRTFCQTENVRRKREPRFIRIDKQDDRRVCKVCIGERERRETAEPRLSVLMGYRIGD